eukprot:TRINITY_DN1219_c0_g1_i2.p2 TRINITY_DN1219_c0_g1~~TRINITY_DN1219_c0_g1_i2.p2  ORF type:complete len:100 (+),score=6.42 TRINITY_DN1219_c0_g1_i2:370-669(+)
MAFVLSFFLSLSSRFMSRLSALSLPEFSRLIFDDEELASSDWLSCFGSATVGVAGAEEDDEPAAGASGTGSVVIVCGSLACSSLRRLCSSTKINEISPI